MSFLKSSHSSHGSVTKLTLKQRRAMMGALENVTPARNFFVRFVAQREIEVNESEWFEVLKRHGMVPTDLESVASSRKSFARCPAWIRENASAEQRADYTPESLRRAASKWFEIEEHKRLGKRPLWLGHRK